MREPTSKPAMRRLTAALTTASAVAIALAVTSQPGAAQDEMPSPAEMWRIIQEQDRMLKQQRQEIDQLKERQAQTDQKVEATGAMVDQVSTEASTGTGWWDRTSIGGYGELHYQGGDTQEVDFHRFVLFVGHEFTDDIRLFTEFELEHALAGDGAPGEVELEQAYVQVDISNDLRANAGVQLLPIGILNEIHEPPTFFGVERNIVESMIIPTTWWEAGLGVQGNAGDSGFSYDLMFHSGLEVPVAGGSAFAIRSGRNKVASAPAEDGAMTGRVRYTGIPGVEVAASGQYQFDVTQGMGDPIDGEGVPGFLLSTHVDARYGGFGLRALYAQWWLDGPTPDMLGKDLQYGYYIEPSYRFPLGMVGDFDLGELGFFGRYTAVDTTAGDGVDSQVTRYTVGMNWWLHPDVVFKLDWFHEDDDAGPDEEGINVGMGYQF